MTLVDWFYVFCTAAADLYCVFVKDFVQLAVVGNVYLIIFKSNDELLLPHICCMVDWTILCSFVLCFCFVFLFGLYFNLTLLPASESIFFYSGPASLNIVCFIRGAVEQSLFYCFWQLFSYVWWMVWLYIYISDIVI